MACRTEPCCSPRGSSSPDEMIHLNNAGSALPAPGVLEVVRSYLEEEARVGGYELADRSAPAIEQAYRDIAGLVGARPRNIAVVESATEGFARALDAFDFSPGDLVLTTRNDYVSNQLAFLSLARRRGVEVAHLAERPEGGADPDDLERRIRARRPVLVSATHVPTSSGLVQPVAEIGSVCRAHDVPYLVDACQSVGQMPVDVGSIGCDFLCATGRKFLRGPRGTGFLFVADRMLEGDRHPLLPDLRGATWTEAGAFELAPDARRFEYWERSYALLLGLGAAAAHASSTGLEEIARVARSHADRLREALAEIDGVQVLDRGPELCAIVTARVGEWEAQALVEVLRERGVNTSAVSADSARLDFDARGVRSALRLSPHFTTTAEEVDRAIAILRDAVSTAA